MKTTTLFWGLNSPGTMKNTEYMDHLNYEEFEDPVLFRMTASTKDTMIPSYEAGKILRNKHGLVEEQETDVALTVGSPRAEFAFDGSCVHNPERVIEDIEDMIDNYNIPPEELDEEARREWRICKAFLDDVTYL